MSEEEPLPEDVYLDIYSSKQTVKLKRSFEVSKLLASSIKDKFGLVLDSYEFESIDKKKYLYDMFDEHVFFLMIKNLELVSACLKHLNDFKFFDTDGPITEDMFNSDMYKEDVILEYAIRLHEDFYGGIVGKLDQYTPKQRMYMKKIAYQMLEYERSIMIIYNEFIE